MAITIALHDCPTPLHYYQGLHLPTHAHLARTSCAFLSYTRAQFSPTSSSLGIIVYRRSRNSSTQALAADMKGEGTEIAFELVSGVSYDKLTELLASGEWHLADEETRSLLIVLAGENAMKRKYVFFSEVQFIPAGDLNIIDSLWRHYSNGKFGYSVQRRIWKCVNEDFTELFKKVGWMKPMAEDSRQYTYRSFPMEFMWELGNLVPEGHLPLTNALRGTQLLKSVLAHPAFDSPDGVLAI